MIPVFKFLTTFEIRFLIQPNERVSILHMRPILFRKFNFEPFQKPIDHLLVTFNITRIFPRLRSKLSLVESINSILNALWRKFVRYLINAICHNVKTCRVANAGGCHWFQFSAFITRYHGRRVLMYPLFNSKSIFII